MIHTALRSYNAQKQLFLATNYSGFSKSPKENRFVIKQETFGDDAYFITISHHVHNYLTGVADGVGGWKEYGVDPSLFSHLLMKNCKSYAKNYCVDSAFPLKILKTGYDTMLSEHPNLLGSSTACVMVIDKITGMLYSVNLGDSGFVIIRDHFIIYQSKEQQHYFNAPYQLTCKTPDQSFLGNMPSEADEYSFLLKSDDIIIMATDGLFDNMTGKQILDIVSNQQKHNSQRIANCLVEEARKLAFDECYISPFVRKARMHGIYATGGKPDDITVIVACARSPVQ
ncbi:uncharacterized protein TRIADDRAFT_30137 [Trichoplax adhaerens]|uniref:Protein phosphatase n=1 Tax=Trichoplax adhaerens TaxID=10228 RepID=B3S663_TRIAD|nr:hypothetical protein TRIADDRAFT_30137 [Trichoplax adhaerens]EDV21568.1 hypothetical protein TRIADDRAFT_30137 [Trichoplax adhaerens]|eukprot:XP_002115716.1 hypothetical protein TRIADDRAFT_30137 [Trichoplax adhaerens]